eukprot:Lankesteria_metandrocarpae@DN1988_c0_g1_i1.p1
MVRKSWVGGNWKCNGSTTSLTELCKMMKGAESMKASVDMVVCPSPVYTGLVLINLSKDMVCSQNISATANGAFTGETSADMLKDLGMEWTLVGHSERRSRYGDTDDVVALKVEQALKAGIKVVLCIGETLEEREANKTTEVVTRQIMAALPKITDWTRVVVAYEPVWAIGTGKVATKEQAQETHAAIRALLKEKVNEGVANSTRIVYGGSVTEGSASSLFSQPDVDGFLVGGASLKPAFVDIIKATTEKK